MSRGKIDTVVTVGRAADNKVAHIPDGDGKPLCGARPRRRQVNNRPDFNVKDRAVWRRTRHPLIGERRDEIIVFRQYGGWRIKRRYNRNVDEGSVGGYRYVDKSEDRATFEERGEAERRAVEAHRDPDGGETAGGRANE